MDYNSLKESIKTEMVVQLSSMGYGYRATVEGCFEALQMNPNFVVANEDRSRMKTECVDEVIEALSNF